MADYKELYRCAPWHKKENLEHLYNECGYSLADIGKIYKVSKQVIWKWMIRFGIDRRGTGGTASEFNKKKYRNRYYLRQQYITLGLSSRKIAENLSVHKSIIARWLVKFNIPRRPRGRHKKEKPNEIHKTTLATFSFRTSGDHPSRREGV